MTLLRPPTMQSLEVQNHCAPNLTLILSFPFVSESSVVKLNGYPKSLSSSLKLGTIDTQAPEYYNVLSEYNYRAPVPHQASCPHHYYTPTDGTLIGQYSVTGDGNEQVSRFYTVLMPSGEPANGSCGLAPEYSRPKSSGERAIAAHVYADPVTESIQVLHRLEWIRYLGFELCASTYRL